MEMECKMENSLDREFLSQFQQFPWMKAKNIKKSKTRKKNHRRKSSNDETNGLVLNGHCIPEEILVHIFCELDLKSLAQCSLVCARWNSIMKQVVWWEKLKSMLGHPIRRDIKPKYIRRFCYEQNFNVNLVQNPCGDEGLKHWINLKGKSIENLHYSQTVWESWDLEAVEEDDPIKNDGITKWFQINYNIIPTIPWTWNQFKTAKCQWIELAKFGFTDEFMDEVQPPILAQDWYRFEWVGENYSITVLLGNENTTKMHEFNFCDGGNAFNRDKWLEMKHVFKNYGKGVRFVYIVHDSVICTPDRLAAKISGTSVIIFSDVLRLL